MSNIIITSDNRTKRGRPKGQASYRTLAKIKGYSKSAYAEVIMVAKYLGFYPQLEKATKRIWAWRVVREIRRIESRLILVNKKYACRSAGFPKEEVKDVIYKQAIDNLLAKGIKIGNLSETKTCSEVKVDE